LNAADDGLLHVSDWGDLAALVTVASMMLGLLWWGIRTHHATERARLQAQESAYHAAFEQRMTLAVQAAATAAANAQRQADAAQGLAVDIDRRLRDVEDTMATRQDLHSLRNDLQSATAQLHVAIEKSAEKTVREFERLLEYALKGRAP
jgi:multidrug efflux pump subunit AcrA (membrane-fusion protein)